MAIGSGQLVDIVWEYQCFSYEQTAFLDILCCLEAVGLEEGVSLTYFDIETHCFDQDGRCYCTPE